MEQNSQPDMDNAADRDVLRRALATHGIQASESFLGGGIHAIEVVLVPDDDREALSVLACSMDASCEVGLSGFRTDGERQIECASGEMLRPETLEQTAAIVQSFWEGREVFIQDFHAGRYDLS